MPRWLAALVLGIEAFNRRIGRMTMYLLFGMMAILLWSSISKTFFLPALWTLETAQFALTAYVFLGGAYALQLGSNVRMDLFYGAWTPRQRSWADAVTIFFLIFYLLMLLYGGLGSLAYSLGFWGMDPFAFYAGLAGAVLSGGLDAAAAEIGTLERSATAWRPVMWPIKTIMCLAILLMLLQAVALFLRDLAALRGRPLPEPRAAKDPR